MHPETPRYVVCGSVGMNLFACTTCNRLLREKIWDDSFLPNLGIMLSAFIVLGILVAALSAAGTRRHGAYLRRFPEGGHGNPVPLATAATVLGIGAGGFIDGVVLHQLLQWHEMISFRLPPDTLINKSVNMFWDGVFHGFCLLVVMVGIILLWKCTGRTGINRSGYLLAGGLLTGWALFNIVEGIIDHHLLKLHNVREITDHVDAWNWGFLLFSLLLLAAGYGLLRKGAGPQRA